MRELRYVESWSGRYRSIAYEIKRLKTRESLRSYSRREFDWTFYLMLNEEAVPEAKRDAFFIPRGVADDTVLGKRGYLFWPSYPSSAMGSLEWHSGITFYEIRDGDVPGHRWIRAGCDYCHLWDDEMPYSLDSVDRDARAAIDSLWDRHPDLLASCGYAGCWLPPSEMKPWGDGLICAKCDVARTKSVGEATAVEKVESAS